MKRKTLLTGVAIALISLSACTNDETLDIGGTLTQDSDKLTISSAAYNVATKTVMADSVLLRPNPCYLGRIKDPETGAYVKSEFTTQFSLLENYSLDAESNIASIYNGVAGADSCQIELFLKSANDLTDTLAALKINASELAVPIPENATYYSNFDPKERGYIRKGGLSKDKMFVYNDLSVSSDVRSSSGYINVIRFILNDPYTDKEGKTYNNYGSYILQQYYRHPEYFKNSYEFIQNVCPGFNITVVDGGGAYAEMYEMGLRVFYRTKNSNDSIIDKATVFAGTEEVLQTVKITNDDDVLQKLIADNTCTYIKSPAGLYTEVTLPVDEIFGSHENDSLMSAKITFQVINSVTEGDDEELPAPSSLLMLPADSLKSFFEKKDKADNVLYYSASSGSKNEYAFSNISTLVTRMLQAKRSGTAVDSNWSAKHPNWNKVLLVPIYIQMTGSGNNATPTNYEHSSTVASTKLVGGTANPYTPVQLKVVYGKFAQ